MSVLPVPLCPRDEKEEEEEAERRPTDRERHSVDERDSDHSDTDEGSGGDDEIKRHRGKRNIEINTKKFGPGYPGCRRSSLVIPILSSFEH